MPLDINVFDYTNSFKITVKNGLECIFSKLLCCNCTSKRFVCAYMCARQLCNLMFTLESLPQHVRLHSVLETICFCLENAEVSCRSSMPYSLLIIRKALDCLEEVLSHYSSMLNYGLCHRCIESAFTLKSKIFQNLMTLISYSNLEVKSLADDIQFVKSELEELLRLERGKLNGKALSTLEKTHYETILNSLQNSAKHECTMCQSRLCMVTEKKEQSPDSAQLF